MSWLRANWLNLAVVLAVMGTVSGWVSSSRWRGVAEVHAATADSLHRVANWIGAENAALSERVMQLRDRYAVDSVAWSEADAENRARIASLTQRGQRTADVLRERLDSVGTALLAEYEATVDSVVATYEVRIADLEAERASLWAQRESLAELVEGLEAESDALRSTNASLRASLDAMARAESAGGLLPDLGALSRPIYALAGGAIGYGLGRLAR